MTEDVSNLQSLKPAATAQRAWVWLTVAILAGAAVMGVLVYRAATQSITHDEASTYNWFIFAGRLKAFDTNDHILHTMLAAMSIKMFGVSELALRLPALLGAGLYLSGTILLCRQLMGCRAGMLLMLGALWLNPFLMDFMVAARGYGLGLALLIWAIFFAVLTVQDYYRHGRYALLLCSVAMGLAVSFMLTMLFPCVAVAAVLSVQLLWRPVVSRRGALACRRALSLLSLAIPGPLLVYLICWPIIQNAQRRHFYIGCETVTEPVDQLLNASFFHNGQFSALPPSLVWAVLLACCLLPAFGWLLATRLGRRDKQGQRVLPRQEARVLRFLFALPLVSLALIWFAHAWQGMKFPVDRTVMYIIPLLTLCLLAGGVQLARGRRWVGLAGGVLACALLVAYLAQFETNFFYSWKYDMSSREAFEAIQRHHAQYLQQHPPKQDADRIAKVGGCWLYEPSMNFYRAKARAAWMPVYGREFLPDTPSSVPRLSTPGRHKVPPPDPNLYDYFVASPKDCPDELSKDIFGQVVSGFTLIFKDPQTDLRVYSRPR